jgi:O-antigen chain-terminating methyltransferase
MTAGHTTQTPVPAGDFESIYTRLVEVVRAAHGASGTDLPFTADPAATAAQSAVPVPSAESSAPAPSATGSRIYVDITNLHQTKARTGIQRVVREVTSRLAAGATADADVAIVWFDPDSERYRVADSATVPAGMLGDTDTLAVAREMTVDEIEAGAIFCDLDAVWHLPLKRPALYRALKARGVTLVNMVYDLVPVVHPEFTHPETLRKFLPYLGAIYTYSDLVLCDSRDAERDFRDLGERLGTGRSIPTVVTKLGTDLPEAGETTPEERALVAPFAGQKYLLFVGTIEPRKRQGLALDAFEIVAKQHPDVHLVFAGKYGWHAEEVRDRIRKHPQFGRRVHWVDKPSDALLRALFDDCFLVLYLSHKEGFGLPIGEALGLGKPVVASHLSSMAEVGKEFADYTYFNAPSEIAGTVGAYLADDELYRHRVEYIRRAYRPYSWDLVVDTITRVLRGLDASRELLAQPVPESLQLVFISNDVPRMTRAIGLWEKYGDFVEEYVVIAPSSMCEDMRAIPAKREVVVFDEETLLGDKLEEFRPAGHVRKNFLLRSLLADLDRLDEHFVMLDDDNHPMVPVSVDSFINPDGTRNAYYFYEMTRWPHFGTSYDRGQHATRRACDEFGLELLAYSSHQPQLLTKSLWREVVALFEPMSDGDGIDEWSAYFNYVATRFPLLYRKEVLQSINWPGRPTDWALMYRPRTYTFENYYDWSYTNGVFTGMSPDAPYDAKIAEYERRVAPPYAAQDLIEASRAWVGETDRAAGPITFDVDGVRIVVAGIPDFVVTTAQHAVTQNVGRLVFSFQVVGDLAALGDVEFCYVAPGEPSYGAVLRPRVGSDTAYAEGVASLPIVTVASSLPESTTEMRFLLRLGNREVMPVRDIRKRLLVKVDAARPAGAVRASVLALVTEASRRKLINPVVVKKAVKGVVRRVVPGALQLDRRRLHEIGDRVNEAHGKVHAVGDDLRKVIVRLDELSTAVARIEKVQSRSDVRLDRLRELAKRVEPYQPTYGITGVFDVAARPSKDRAVAIERFLGRLRGKRILDIGSSLGYMDFFLADRGAHTEGWDFRAENVEVARQVGAINGIPAKFRTKPLDQDTVQTVHGGDFDVVLLLSVLHHIIHFQGLETAKQLVAQLLDRVPVLIVELAEKGEDAALFWDEAQPEDPREVLALVADVADVHLLGRFPTHLSGQDRGLYAVVRRQSVAVNGRDYAYDSVTREAYEGSPMAERNYRRRYYFGPDYIIKEYLYSDLKQQEFRQAINEISLAVNVLAPAKVWHIGEVVDFEFGVHEVRTVLKRIPGKLVSDSGELPPEVVEQIAADLLRTVGELAELGVSHNDIRSWNVLLNDEGAWLVDFGLAGSPDRPKAEDSVVAILWVLWAATTGVREPIATGKTALPPAEVFAGDRVRRLYDAVSGGERSIAALRQILAE